VNFVQWKILQLTGLVDGIDIKNLCSGKLRIAALYRHAKFRDDMTKFRNI